VSMGGRAGHGGDLAGGTLVS
jgi:hypothetical protein